MEITWSLDAAHGGEKGTRCIKEAHDDELLLGLVTKLVGDSAASVAIHARIKQKATENNIKNIDSVAHEISIFLRIDSV